MDIFQNPFFLLDATVHDDRVRITQLAEEKSLHSDSDVIAEARSILTNPRKRLAAEVAWLPGLEPELSKGILAGLRKEPWRVRTEQSLPALARSNLLATALVHSENEVGSLGAQALAALLIELAEAYESIDPESTIDLINEDRSHAKFPKVIDPAAIESELDGRRRYYRLAIKGALDNLPSAKLVETITAAVESTTSGGTVQAPILIDDLVDTFEVEAQGFFEQETQNIRSLMDEIKSAAASQKSVEMLTKLTTRLAGVLSNWDFVAQPIQLSSRSRGIGHTLSLEIAGEIRQLAVELYNQHGHIEVSQALTGMLRQVFAELDSVKEVAAEDMKAIHQIVRDRTRHLEAAEAKAAQWRREITYQTEIGSFVKERFKISPEGVEWQGQRWPLNDITRIRWGGTKHSFNGIPTQTSYQIFVGSASASAIIRTNNETVYSEINTRLWKAVGVRILTSMLEGLRDGRRYQFGVAVVDDYGVALEDRPSWGKSERVHCPWNKITYGNVEGGFYIAWRIDPQVSVALPYQEIDNVHILATAIQYFGTLKNAQRLSDLLSQPG